MRFYLMGTLMLFSFVCSAYEYKGNEITEKQFNKVYEYYKDKLFVDESGIVYDLRDEKNQIKKFKGEDVGIYQGFIIQVNAERAVCKYMQRYTREHAELKRNYRGTPGDTRVIKVMKEHFRPVYFAIKGLNPEQLEKDKEISCCVAHVKTISINGIELELFQALNPISKSVFADYIKTNKLFIWKKRVIPAEYEICKSCLGRGKVRTSRKKLSFEKCYECNGTGKITKKAEKIEYYKKFL